MALPKAISTILSVFFCIVLGYYGCRDALLIHPNSVISLQDTLNNDKLISLTMHNGKTKKYSVSRAIMWSPNFLVLYLNENTKRQKLLPFASRSVIISSHNTQLTSGSMVLSQEHAVRRLRTLIEHDFYRPIPETNET